MKIGLITFLNLIVLLVFGQKTNIISYQTNEKGSSENFSIYPVTKEIANFNPSLSINYTVPYQDKWGLYDRYEKEILPPVYDTIITNSPLGYIVRDNDLYGVVNSKNEILVPINFEEINYCDFDTVALVKKNNKWCFWEKDSLVFDYELVFYYPDKSALFKDCKLDFEKSNVECSNKKFYEFISKYLIYPRKARDKSIQGMALISIEISPNGGVYAFNVENEIHPILVKQCEKLVRRMNDWKPAEHEGKKVWSRIIFPLSFRLY